MSKEFNIQILTPGREVMEGEVTEVVLPAHDGEKGILANHENLIGLLGTGAVKIVREKNDYWFMVSSGVYQVEDGKLTLFAELAETAAEVDVDLAKTQLEELEQVFIDHSKFTPEDYPQQKLRYDQSQARLEVHRRTEVVN